MFFFSEHLFAKVMGYLNLKLHLRDPFSGLSHLFGALLTIPALAFMLMNLPVKDTVIYMVSYVVFSLSMLLMFGSSAVYHLMEISDAGIRQLKRIDHMAIFIMIAGSYTPFCLLGLKGEQAYWMLAFVWSIAIAGIGIKIFWLHAPRWLSTTLYLGMGWAAIMVFEPLKQNLSAEALDWLLAGGIAYTAGAIVYATKWPSIHAKYFDFHDFWHVFVLAGAACHFVSIALYL